MIDNLFEFALNVGAGAIALLCLFDGMRRLGAYGAHRKAVLLIIVGGGVCALYGAFAYKRYGELRAVTAAAQRKPAAAQTPATWSKAASPEKRELLSQALARQAFKESGTLGTYIDRSGQAKAYVATQEDLVARDRVVAYYSRTEYAARSSLAEALLWLVAAVVAIFLGLALSLDSGPPKPEQGGALPDDAPQAR